MANEPVYSRPCDGCISLPTVLKFQVWDLAIPAPFYRDYVDSDFGNICAACLTPAVGATSWDGTLHLKRSPEAKTFSCHYRPDGRVHKVNDRQNLLFNDILIYRSSDDVDSAVDAWERGFCETNAGVWIFHVMCHESDDCTDRTFPSHVVWRAHSSSETPESVFTYMQGCEDGMPRGRMVAI